MEHSEEFYKSVIRVIDYLAEGNSEVSCNKGEELAGNYWPAVVTLFKEMNCAIVMMDGSIHITQGQYLSPIYEDCKKVIDKYDKEEEARMVDMKYKIKGILYGRISLIISGLAFLLSLWVAFRQAGIF